jgi:hypothetical protein
MKNNYQEGFFVFRYEGDLEYIDINTLITSQYHLTTVINEVKNEVCPENKLEIKIKPLEKASWPIELKLLLENYNLFSAESVNYISNIIEILVGLIALRVFLGGRKEETKIVIDNRVIINLDNRTFETNETIYNIHAKNVTVDSSFNRAFEAIENDEDIDSIKITNRDNSDLIKVSRPEFSNVKAENEMFNEKTDHKIVANAPLRIFKVVFGEGFKWQFYFGGNKISANIEDDAFIQRVSSGEPFCAGDIIMADMRINMIFDNRVDSFINKSYVIEKVNQHIKRSEQTKMDLDE